MRWRSPTTGVVARHELTHAFNLSQTGFSSRSGSPKALRCAEHTPDSTESRASRDRLAEGTAFDLETIGRATTTSATHRTCLAYYQGFQYVQFIEKHHAPKPLAKLLEASARPRRRRRDPGVRSGETAVERGYREYLRGIVKGVRE